MYVLTMDALLESELSLNTDADELAAEEEDLRCF
jgi:hypothetical protein